MKKTYNLKFNGCEATYELDGYLFKISGKNLDNNCDDVCLSKIYNQVVVCTNFLGSLVQKEEEVKVQVHEVSEESIQSEERPSSIHNEYTPSIRERSFIEESKGKSSSSDKFEWVSSSEKEESSEE